MTENETPTPVVIKSIEDFTTNIRADSASWTSAWFRGEPNVVSTQDRPNDRPLLPRLYRAKEDGSFHHENKLLQHFRMKAPTFSHLPCPLRTETDKWLFLAQHVGLPTRLLDWTESALVGLYFALRADKEKRPAKIWMMNPHMLNELSDPTDQECQFPLTWFNFPKEVKIDLHTGVLNERMIKVNIGSVNINGAWEKDSIGVERPVAIHPTNIHPRMSVQRSCFTVHGRNKQSLLDQVPHLLRCYEIDISVQNQMIKELRRLGISYSTVYPDIDGLATELREVF